MLHKKGCGVLIVPYIRQLPYNHMLHSLVLLPGSG